MGYKCCVPNCNSNYKTGPKITIFRFPKEEKLLRKWLSAIPRENFTPTKNSRVCRLHFKEEDILNFAEGFNEKTGEKISVALPNARLKVTAVPEIFPNCPKYLTKTTHTREDPTSRNERLDNINFKAAIQESMKTLESYNDKYGFKSFEELLLKISEVNLSENWHILKSTTYILIFEIFYEQHPSIRKSLTVNNNLEVSVHLDKISLKHLGKHVFPLKCSSLNAIEDILNTLMNIDTKPVDYVKEILNSVITPLSKIVDLVDDDKKNNILLIIQQLDLFSKKKMSLKYSPDFLILTTLLFSISPHAYRFLRSSGYLILPHPNTLKSLCSNFDLNPQNDNLNYIKNKLCYLNENDKKVVFMLDEIYLKPYLDFKGGDIIGVSSNSDNAATTAFVFMVQSITSKYKDVISVIPVQKVDAEYLHKILLNTIIELEKLGFSVICISSDNNSINRKAISLFSNPPKLTFLYVHPSNSTRPLFFIRDSVHLFKCIRNNWLNQKNHDTCFFFPNFDDNDQTAIKTASFKTLQTLFEIEKIQLLKYCHTLTKKSVSPSNLDKQNVKLVMQIFNLNLVEGLLIAGEKYNLPNFKDTAEFIKIIATWWDIMNVKTIFKGVHKRNVFQEPLSFTDDSTDQKLCFLNSFLDWLDRWKKCQFDTGILSEETHTALWQTTYGILEICRFCKDELGMGYILTGKFQTDALENRFGQYRQLAGGQYHISLTQLLEVEKKLRIQSILPLKLKSSLFGDIPIESPNNMSLDDVPLDLSLPKDHIVFLQQKFNFSLEDEDILSIVDIEEVLAYIAGYCIHSCLNKLKCNFCRGNITISKESGTSFTLINSMDRGGLMYPSLSVVEIISTCYLVALKLLSEDYEKKFVATKNHRAVAFSLIEHHLKCDERSLDFDSCINGHSSALVQKLIIHACINIFLKNYCKNMNNSLQEASNKKRKLKTLTDSKIDNTGNVEKKENEGDAKSKFKKKTKSKKNVMVDKVEDKNEDSKAKKKAAKSKNLKRGDAPLNLAIKRKKSKK